MTPIERQVAKLREAHDRVEAAAYRLGMDKATFAKMREHLREEAQTATRWGSAEDRLRELRRRVLVWSGNGEGLL